ncbi:MAG: tetratricopeptide repeat protein [Bdellovibrionales bacterium]|nr:tetratricopeptide repeat protein [Bdellovibrionales bacterium]
MENDELFQTAKELFDADKYAQAETLLNQLILQNRKSPHVFQMLGTIYYDQGKFTKAIRAFRRAIEIDPSFTDASLGLSIILNDLGKYEEGRKVFEEAQVMLQKKSAEDDPYVNEKLALKHDELGELYVHYNRYKEALDQYFKALSLSTRRPEITMKIVDCFKTLGEYDKAFKELRDLIKQYPMFIGARLKLGKFHFEKGDVIAAIEAWEGVLERDPENAEAARLLKQAQAKDLTSFNEIHPN